MVLESKRIAEYRFDVHTALRSLEKAQLKVEAASARRRDLPAGSSRAKVTTANARWMSACEERDRRKAWALELLTRGW